MSANNRPKRVLVCEDSQTYSAALTRVLQHGREIDVVGVCATAEAALRELTRLKPDLLTLDIELPGMSGLEAVEEIMGATPLPILVISSTVSSRASANVAAALAAGALDVLPKDELDLRDPGAAGAVELRRRVKLLSGARVIRHPRARLATRTPHRPSIGRAARAIGICASTGGPQALMTVLRALPNQHPIPVLVVQHIASGFTVGFARWLDREIPLPVRVAQGGEELGPGVWIAPDGLHLLVSPDHRLVVDDAGDSIHRPSGDVLFHSLARSLAAEAAGIVLTGMGRDGAEGLAAIRSAGGLTIAQDEQTSVVYGMPKAAATSAELIMAPDAIGAQLAHLRLATGAR